MFKRRGESAHQHTLMRIPESEATPNSALALLEPEPEPELLAPVMERAKSIIAPFDPEHDLMALGDEIARLTREESALFGIEAQATTALKDRKSGLERDYKKARAFDRFAGEKLRLSNEVLTWRKPVPMQSGKFTIPLPEVGLFGLSDNNLWLRADWPSRGDWHPSLPWHLTGLYKDVYSQLGALSEASVSAYSFGRTTFSLSATFSGVFPAQTREKIREAEAAKAFEGIRVLAETDWVLNATPSPFYADPIVVGLVGDEMWVIDVFDPTPLEDYIAREFTT